MVRMKKHNVERIVSKEKAQELSAKEFVCLEAAQVETNLVSAENGPEDLSEKSLAELKAMAKEKGLTGYSSLNKEDLLIVLGEDLGGEDDDRIGETEEADGRE